MTVSFYSGIDLNNTSITACPSVASNSTLTLQSFTTTSDVLIKNSTANRMTIDEQGVKCDLGKLYLGSTNSSPAVISGTGAPESAVTAPSGSVYLRSNGGDNTTVYLKKTGAGSTGWVQIPEWESGTFTPTLSYVSATYTSQSGKYRKIGDLYFADVYLNIASLDTNDTSLFTVSGLPASLAETGRAMAQLNLFQSSLLNPAAGDIMLAESYAGTSEIRFVKENRTGWLYADNNSAAARIFNTSGKLYLNLTYIA